MVKSSRRSCQDDEILKMPVSLVTVQTNAPAINPKTNLVTVILYLFISPNPTWLSYFEHVEMQTTRKDSGDVGNSLTSMLMSAVQ